MFCSNCGKENNNGENFCSNCGNRLIDKNDIKKSDGNQETSLILGIICLISSFFLNIICFIPGIISIIYAKKYKKESGKLGVGFGLSLGGMIFSLIVLILFVMFFIFVLNIVGDSINNIDNYIKTEYIDGLPRV